MPPFGRGPLSPDLSKPGGRAKAIRLELGQTTEVFAETLNDAVDAIGMTTVWRASKVTQIETGVLGVSAETAVIYAHLDPQRRGWTWVYWGVAAPADKGTDAYTVLRAAAKKDKRG